MATTSNTYSGNGSNKLFSITFPYLETTDVDVYLNGVLKTIVTDYFYANATTIEFVTAPGSGATVLLNRSTDDADLLATFFPGSSIRAADLNLDFEQTLFIAQETANIAAATKSTANTALANSNTAVSAANAAVSTANGIASTANTALSTANTALSTVSAATSANTPSAIVARDASGNFAAGTITAALSGNASTVTTNANLTGDITSVGNTTTIAAGVIVNADINSAAAISGSKIVAATTSVIGTVQLSDSTSTTSSVLAATPTAVKSAYDLADLAGTIAVAALPKAGGTMTGAITFAGGQTFPGVGSVTGVTGTSPIASSGGATPNISIQDGTTAQKGAVQLENSTSSTSITKAATPASVKSAYDLANAAATAVSTALIYNLVANVAAIPATPANNDAIEIINSTGIESFTPLVGKPVGFVGDSGLSVRLVFTTTGSTWNWIQYFANNSEDRYANKANAVHGLGTDKVFLENDQLITTSYTITTNKNALTVGNIVVNPSITVTVPVNSTWVII